MNQKIKIKNKDTRNYSEITDEINALASLVEKNNAISGSFYDQYDVKRGLRDIEGRGVLAGLTNVSEVCARKIINGNIVPAEGELLYRGYNIKDLIDNCLKEDRFGFEEVVYLLLFGELPTREELDSFYTLLGSYRSLPPSFVRDVIMKATSSNLMNSLSKSILTLYSYDNNPDDISIPNVLRQCIQLIAVFPLITTYSYQAYNLDFNGKDFFINTPDTNLSTSENILRLLRPDGNYSKLEATVLDIALILHAEHGGGNNSTFTTRVVTSSGTDTYSAISAALGSLKGPKHGGANLKVVDMMANIQKNVKDPKDDEEISAYLYKILNKEVFDKMGLIYGIGHAIYSVSDPRAVIFKSFVEKLAKEKGMDDEYNLYSSVERLAPVVISNYRKMYKGVSANVDFYSGFAYKMLGLPVEIYTPIFATSRVAGWSAHRLEELVSAGKIIRPAYQEITERKKYIPIEDR